MIVSIYFESYQLMRPILGFMIHFPQVLKIARKSLFMH